MSVKATFEGQRVELSPVAGQNSVAEVEQMFGENTLLGSAAPPPVGRVMLTNGRLVPFSTLTDLEDA